MTTGTRIQPPAEGTLVRRRRNERERREKGKKENKTKKKTKKTQGGGEKGTTNGSRGPAWPPAHASSPPLKGTLVRRTRNESPDGKREGEEERKKERKKDRKETKPNTKKKHQPTNGSRGQAWPPAHASSPPLKEPKYAGDATKERGGKRERRKTKKKKGGGRERRTGSRGPA